MTDRETILAAYRFTLGYAEKLAADLADEELGGRPLLEAEWRVQTPTLRTSD